MTREEAIKGLETLSKSFSGYKPNEEMFEMAISALKAQTDGDTISRQAAIDAMCSACGYDCDKSRFVYNASQDEQVIICPEHYALSTLPSAQPELSGDTLQKIQDLEQAQLDKAYELGKAEGRTEIVRCKDCKHRGEKPIADGRYWCDIHDTFMFYCSDAERRTDEQTVSE